MLMSNPRSFSDLVNDIPQMLAPSLAQDWPKLPVVKAEGAYLHALDGRTYLDFTSGIATTNTGHCHPKVVAAARAQMERMIHGAVGVTIHESVLRLAEALPEVLPEGMDMFFFGNSGAEAVEGAIKLARYVTRRPAIIAFQGGFHGRTYGAASVTSVKARYRLHYEPFVGGVYFAPYADCYRCPYGQPADQCASACLDGVRQLLERVAPPEQVAAMLIEPILGEGGYVVPPPEFLHGLRQICDETGILLIFDEVQTGFGRTGQMFAAQTFGVRPDIMAIAKGIASGFPLSATVASRELMSQWLMGSHGTTYGGNPVACAAALATLEVIEEEGLLENCREQGTYLLESLRQLQSRHPVIGDVRGKGLMIGLDLIVPGSDREPNGEAAQRVLDACLERGLLLYSAGLHGQVVRLIPPLIITREQADQALEILDESLALQG